MENDIPVGDAISFGWNKTRENLGFFIISYLVAGLAMLPAGVLMALTVIFAAGSDWSLAVLFGLLTVLAWSVAFVSLFIVYVKASLAISAGKPAVIRDCLPTWSEWWKLFFANCIYATSVGVGLMLCIVPGIWLAVRYWSYSWHIVIDGLGPIEALEKAADLSEGFTLKLWIFFIVCGVILTLGFMIFVVGLAVAFPIVLMATTYVYSRLAKIPVVE